MSTNYVSHPFVAKLSDGVYVIMVPDPALPGWWHEEGPRRPSFKEVLSQARKRGLEITISDARPISRGSPRIGGNTKHNPPKDERGLTPLWAAVLKYLEENAGSDGIARVSQTEISKGLGKGQSGFQAVSYAVTRLIDLGFIAQRAGGHGRMNVYRVLTLQSGRRRDDTVKLAL